jgi:hypothetical protein
MSLQYVKYIEAILPPFRTCDLTEIKGQAQANFKAAKQATVNLCLSFSSGRYKNNALHVISAGRTRKTHLTSGRRRTPTGIWTKIGLSP